MDFVLIPRKGLSSARLAGFPPPESNGASFFEKPFFLDSAEGEQHQTSPYFSAVAYVLACYSWLQNQRIIWLAPKIVQKVDVDMPILMTLVGAITPLPLGMRKDTLPPYLLR